MGHAALRLWRHKTVWMVEEGEEGRAVSQLAGRSSRRLECRREPLYGRKNGRYHCLCKLFKISGAKAGSPPRPFVFSGGAVSVKTFRDYSSTTADGSGMSAGEELGIPANEGIPVFPSIFVNDPRQV